MNKRRLGRTDIEISPIGLGCWQFSYSPLAQGLLSGRIHENPALVRSLPAGRRSRLSPASRGFTPGSLARTTPLVEELRTIGKSHGASASQVAVAWLVTYYGDTVVAIPGASRPEQARECAAAMSLRLTEAEMARIEESSARIARL